MARPKGTADGVNVIHHPAMVRSLERAADCGAVVLVAIVVGERRSRTRAEQLGPGRAVSGSCLTWPQWVERATGIEPAWPAWKFSTPPAA